MTSRKLQYWVIPPEADAEFVAAMERVLDTYEKPYDADHPVLCMDEQPVQLTQETRRPIPATRRHAKRVDYEYERAGTASIFLFTEPREHGWVNRSRLTWGESYYARMCPEPVSAGQARSKLSRVLRSQIFGIGEKSSGRQGDRFGESMSL